MRSSMSKGSGMKGHGLCPRHGGRGTGGVEDRRERQRQVGALRANPKQGA